MATLTLKKKPPANKMPERQRVADIAPTDLIDMYAVTRLPYASTTCKFTSIHPTRERANAEATRLLEISTDARFLIVQVVGEVG